MRRDVGAHVAEASCCYTPDRRGAQAGVDAARAAVHAAEAAAREADANYQRYLALSRGQYVSKTQLEQAHAVRDSARAALDAARAQLSNVGQQAAYTTIRAPYAGIVASRDVEQGESVGSASR